MIAVIPAYQPDEKLKKLVLELKEKTDYPIVIVDDGSSEECRTLFDELTEYAVVLHHEVNRGKGRAMKTAFEYIRDCGLYAPEEGIITVDADGQHLPEDIVRVSEEFKRDPSALVIGGRRFAGKVPLRSRMGNGITRVVFALTTGVRVHDTQTGLRAFAVKRIDEMLAIGGDRYEYEINQLLYCTKQQIKIREVEIETVYINENRSSHFHAFRDSFRIYKTIFSFIGSSILCWLIDYVLLLGLTAIFTKTTGGAGITLFGMTLEPKLPAIIIARAVSSFVNYLLNRRVVFKSGGKSSVVRYYISVVAVLALNYALLHVMTTAGIPLAVAQILAQIIIYPLNFVVQRKFVFCEKKKTQIGA